MRVYEILAEADEVLPSTAQSAITEPSIWGAVGMGAAGVTAAAYTAKKGSQLVDYFRKRRLKNLRRSAVYEKRWEAKYQPWSRRLFYVLGIAVPVWQLGSELLDAEEQFKAKELSQRDYEIHREAAFSVFSAQILTPLLARAIKGLVLMRIARWIKNGLALVSAPATAGVSIAGAITSEVAMRSLEAFLVSDKGREWLRNEIIMQLVRFPATTLSDLSSKFASIYDHMTDDKPQPSTSPAASTPADTTKSTQSPARAAQYAPREQVTKSGKQVKIAGLAVTDRNGYLDPTLIWSPDIRAARQVMINRGEPDPFASIPKKPGADYAGLLD
jgi:hypothetical protein